MLFTLIIAAVAGALITSFFDEILKWADNIFEELSAAVKTAWVYIKRIPGGIVQFVRFMQNGRMKERKEEREMTLEEVERLIADSNTPADMKEALKEYREKLIAERKR